MILYHGTNLASIGSILEKGKLIGTRMMKKHKHAYLSFSPNISVSHDFGLIILAFHGIESRVIPFKDFDFDWSCKHIEIYEYVDGQEYETDKELHESSDWEGNRVTEYVAVNEFTFQPNEVKVLICGGFEPERKEVFKRIQRLYGQKYEIIEQEHLSESIAENPQQLRIYTYENYTRDDLNELDFYNGFQHLSTSL